jgi:hypothetical protein
MKRKLILAAFFTVIMAGGVFAQEKYDGSSKNTIFFGASLAGYERAIFNGFSAGVEAGVDLLGVDTAGHGVRIMPFFADAFARWYPWQKIFFANLGLGYQGGGIGISLDGSDDKPGVFHIKPQAGWKIDIGQPGGWIFEARAGMGLTVGGDGSLITFTVPILFGRTF